MFAHSIAQPDSVSIRKFGGNDNEGRHDLLCNSEGLGGCKNLDRVAGLFKRALNKAATLGGRIYNKNQGHHAISPFF
jgi:hypothetical protein